MSKTQLLLVTVPALLMLGFVGRDGVITRQWCCSLVLTYGWSIWSHQNKMTVAFPVHTWKALGHTQRQHAHTCRNVHVVQREKGKWSFQMTIHLGLSGYSTGTNFPKQYFHLSFSSLWLLCYLAKYHVFPLGYRVTIGQFSFLRREAFKLWAELLRLRYYWDL